jgi:cytoskeletal protein CcmA (bactofilin family)
MMNNLIIDGVSTVSGGSYNLVDIDGVCTINGDLKADRIDIDGVTTINGSLGGGDLDVNGTTTIRGGVDVKQIDIDGVCTIEGNLRIQTGSIDGCVSVKGSRAEAEAIHCDGYLKVNGELNAEVVEADGYIDAREIVGERIVIRSRSNKFANFIRRFKINLGTFDFIEATQVDLTNVRAKVVHGKNIVIGKKCNIDTIDCSGTLSIAPSATVKEITGVYSLM